MLHPLPYTSARSNPLPRLGGLSQAEAVYADFFQEARLPPDHPHLARYRMHLAALGPAR